MLSSSAPAAESTMTRMICAVVWRNRHGAELSEMPDERGWGESARETAREWSENARSKARSVRERARRLGASARHRVGETGEHLWDGARDAGDRASYYGRRVRRGFFDTLHEQPLVLGALGLAAGAAIGAALPVTERGRVLATARPAQGARQRGELGAGREGAMRRQAPRTAQRARGGAAGLTLGREGRCRSTAEAMRHKAERVAEAARAATPKPSGKTWLTAQQGRLSTLRACTLHPVRRRSLSRARRGRLRPASPAARSGSGLSLRGLPWDGATFCSAAGDRNRQHVR
jgi:hypothetical protein